MSSRGTLCLTVLFYLAVAGCSAGDEQADGGGVEGGFAGSRGSAAAAAVAPESDVERFARAREPFFGDLAEIRQRRILRALVSYSKTSFFHDGPEVRGFEVEMLRKFEAFLNQGTDDPYA